MAFRNPEKAKAIGNADDDLTVEQNILIPWTYDPASSYMYYDCSVGVLLDSGIVVHNRLPQVNNAFDTLSMVGLDDPKIDRLVVAGVNLKGTDQYQDIVQRMGHARYWFHLWGRAMRVGYQIPIPSIKLIGGVPVIPHDMNPQWACNSIVPCGNYSGVILWRAEWSLWYTTATPPVNQTIPVVDAAAHIGGDAKLPAGMQSPYSQADDDAVQINKLRTDATSI